MFFEVFVKYFAYLWICFFRRDVHRYKVPPNKLPIVFFWVLYKPIGDLYKVWWKRQEGIFLQDVFDALVGA